MSKLSLLSRQQFSIEEVLLTACHRYGTQSFTSVGYEHSSLNESDESTDTIKAACVTLTFDRFQVSSPSFISTIC
jgi:hypothetical protein